MTGKSFSMVLKATAAIFVMTVYITSTYAATEKVLHNFNDNGGGTYPYAGLIFDAAHSRQTNRPSL